MPTHRAKSVAGWFILAGWFLATAGLWLGVGLWAALLSLAALLIVYGLGLYQMAQQREAFARHVEKAKELRDKQPAKWN